MLEDLQKRITELEIGFSHQSQLVDELNEVITDCNLRIGHLQKQNQQLQEMIKNLSPEMEQSPDE